MLTFFSKGAYYNDCGGVLTVDMFLQGLVGHGFDLTSDGQLVYRHYVLVQM
jgi:hypothetical protein